MVVHFCSFLRYMWLYWSARQFLVNALMAECTHQFDCHSLMPRRNTARFAFFAAHCHVVRIRFVAPASQQHASSQHTGAANGLSSILKLLLLLNIFIGRAAFHQKLEKRSLRRRVWRFIGAAHATFVLCLNVSSL